MAKIRIKLRDTKTGREMIYEKGKDEIKPKKGDWNNKWVASAKKMIIKRRAKRA